MFTYLDLTGHKKGLTENVTKHPRPTAIGKGMEVGGGGGRGSK